MMSDIDTGGIVSVLWIGSWWVFGSARMVLGGLFVSVKDGRCLGAYRWGEIASLLGDRFSRLFFGEENFR